MLVGRIVKELSDTNRRTVDFTPLLDPGESIWIQTSKVILGNTGWSTQPFPATPPADPTPLEIQSITLVNNATAVQVYVRGGSAGNVYTVQFTVLGVTSLRIWTVEIGVQITGTPLVLPPPVPNASLTSALPIGGGNMLGPLFLFEDPLSPGEAATKRYVDNNFALFAADQASEATARAAEDASLQAQITAEVTRAEAAETVNANAISTEVARAEAAEAAINAGLASEIATRGAGDASLLSTLETEVSTRGAADTALQAAITTEVARAEAAEAVLTAAVSGIGLAAEVTRAEAAELVLTNGLAAEITRAEAAEGVLTTAVAALGNSKFAETTTDGTGHVRITYGTPFATSTDAIALTVLGAGFFTLCIVGQADRFGIDVYTSNSATAVAEGPVQFSWIAFGH